MSMQTNRSMISRGLLASLWLALFSASAAYAQTSVDNAATVTAPPTVIDTVPGNDTDNVATPVVAQNAALTLTKTQTGGPNPVTTAGQVIDYTIVVENTGNVTQTGVSASDTLPDGSAGSLIGPTESLNPDGQLEVGETWTYTISYTVSQAEIDAGADLVNSASVSTTEVPGPTTDTAITAVNAAASLNITKTQTGGPNPVTAAGQVIDYTIVVENTGNVTQTGVSTSDTLPDGSAGVLTGPTESLNPDGQLQVGETWTYTISYAVTQADIDAGVPLVNTASVTTTQVPGPTEDTASTTVTGTPSLTLVKTQTGGPDPVTTAGEVIDYTIVVENTGNVTQTGVTTSDLLPDGSAGTLSGPVESISANGQLDVGETWTYTISYAVTQADIDAGVPLVNTASVVTDHVPGPTEDTATTAVSGSASLTISKTQTGGPDPVTAAGQVIDYTIVVENTGNVTQTGVTTSDLLPDGSAGTLIGPTESLNPDGQLEVGETWTYTISYTVTQADIDAGLQLINTASVTTAQVPGPTEDTAITAVSGSASLTIAKTQTGGPDPVTTAGEVIDYTIVVENTGNVTQTGVTTSDVLPDGSAGALIGPAESISANGQLDIGETWTYTISYTVTQADIDAGVPLVNTASVTTTQVPGPTEDTASTTVTGTPSLTLVKTQTGGPDPVTTAGEVIDYTIVVENTGNVTQTGVTTSDLLPDGSAGTLSGPVESISANGQLDVGETWTYTISYAVTQADIDAGVPLVNTASVVTDHVPGPTEDTATTAVSGSASLTISKIQTGGPNPVTAAGEVIDYTIVVENTGNVTQTGVTTSDLLPDGSAGTLSGPVESISANGQLDVGETWTYTISYAVTQADIDAGVPLVNTASVVTDHVPGPTEDTATTAVSGSASLTIVKTQTGGPNPVTAAGQVIDYTIVVENTGNVTQTGVTTSDTLPDGSAGTLIGPTESISANGQLEVGETWTYTISYTVTQADIDAGLQLINTASVTTAQVPGPTEDTAITAVSGSASLTIAKTQTGGPDPVTTAGEVIDYTIVVENTGNVTQTGVTTSDVLPDGSAGALIGPVESISANGQLDVGETWTYTISYAVTQADIDAGVPLVNTASVVTDHVPGPTEDTATTAVSGSASLTISKIQTGGPDPVTAAGEVIDYTIVVENTGNVTQTGVTTSDLLPDGSAGTLSGPVESISANGQLDVGETWTYTISYAVTQADIDAGVPLVNTASVVTDHVPGPTEDTATTAVSGSASLTIVKTQTGGPNPVTAAGQVIDYTIVVENTGNVTQTGVTTSDTLPDGSAGTLIGPTESLNPDGQLEVGETWTYTISYTVSQPDIDAGADLVNTATVSTTQVPGPTSDTATTPVSGTPSLTIVKTQTGGPNPVTAAGQVIDYTIVVENTGNVTQTGVTTSDTLPGGSAGTLIGPTESLNPDGQLEVGETWTYTISYTVSQPEIDAGADLVNTATVSTTQVPGPTSDTATTPVSGTPSLTIVKTQTGGPNPVTAAGQVIDYTIVVENTGNVTQTGVTTSDTLPDGSAGTLIGPTESMNADGQLEVGETWTYTISYTVSQPEIDAGADLVNTARVTTTQVPGPTSDSATTPVVPPQISAAKTSSPGSGTPVTAGETITYTLTVDVSDGPTTANVVLSDTLDADLSNFQVVNAGAFTVGGSNPYSFTLASGAASGTYTVVYSADVSASAVGTVGNSVVVTGDGGDPDPECTSCTTGHPVADPAVVVTKSADPASGTIVTAGQTITYTLSATVTDAALSADLVLSDTLGAGLTFGAVTAPGAYTVNTAGNPLTFMLPSGTVAGTYAVEYTVTVDDDASGSVDNNVIVTGDGGDPDPECSSCSTNHPVADPAVAVVKSANPANGSTVTSGSTITYTVTATVEDAALTSDLVLSDTLGAGLTFGAVTSAGAFSADVSGAPLLTFTLPAGTVPGTYAIEYTGTIDADANGSVDNNVVVTGDGGDPDPECTGCSTSHPVLNVEVSKLADPVDGSTVVAGDVITYTVTATVLDGTLISDLVLTDTLGAGLTFGAVTDSGAYSPDVSGAPSLTFTLPAGTVPGSYAVEYTATVDPDASGTVDNSVVPTGNGGDPDPSCTSCSTSHPVLGVAVSKTSDPIDGSTVAAGDTLTYSVTATVTGAALTADLVLTDTLGSGLTFGAVTSAGAYTADVSGAPTLTFTLPAGTLPGSYSIEYTATVDPDAAGSVGNNVVVTGDGGDPDPECDTCFTSHPLTDPVIVVGKTSTPASGVDVVVGQTIDYTVTVEVSNAALTSDLVLTDTLGAGLTLGVVTDPGAFTPDLSAAPVLTFTLPSGTVPGIYPIDYTAIVDADAGGTTVGNTVEPAGGGDPDPECTSCTTTHPVGTLALDKRVVALSATGPNSWRIDYEIEVANPGQVAVPYTLIDTLGFTTTGLQVGSTGLVSTTGGVLDPAIAAGQFTPVIGSALQVSDTDVPIGAGETHRYQLSIPVGVVAGQVQDGACDGSAGNGLYNLAEIPGTPALAADACATIDDSGEVAIELIKTVELGVDFDGNGYGDVGDVLFYAFEITNIGAEPLSDVQLIDLLVDDLVCMTRTSDGQTLQVLPHDAVRYDGFEQGGLGVLNPSASIVCSATHELTAQDVARRRVENTATALGTGPSGEVVSSVSTAVYTSFQ